MTMLTVEQALEMPTTAPERLALMRELSASPAEADQAQYRRLFYDAVLRHQGTSRRDASQQAG